MKKKLEKINLIKSIENITEKEIIALTQFLRRYEELRGTKFFKFYSKGNSKFELSYNKDNGSKVSFKEVDLDTLKSFLSIYRQFTLENEVYSIRALRKNLFGVNGTLLSIFPEETKEFNDLRNNFHSYLEKDSPFKLSIQIKEEKYEFSKNSDYLNVLIYGWHMHANPDKVEKYDAIFLNNDDFFGHTKRKLFLSNSTFILNNCVIFINNFAVVINNILSKIINFNETCGNDNFGNGDYKKSIFFFKRALYIANHLKRKELRAKFHKKLMMNFDKMDNISKVKEHKERYNSIMNSISPLPKNFWSIDYFRENFTLPQNFKEELERVTGPFDEIFPIIILPIEKIHEVKKFENFTKVIDVSYNKETSKVFYRDPFPDKMEIKIQNGITGEDLVDGINGENGSFFWINQEISINTKKDYLLHFPFRYSIGSIFITNSPFLFVREYLKWIELVKISQIENSRYLVEIQKYIQVLINVEQGRNISLETVNELKRLRTEKSIKVSIIDKGKTNVHTNYLLASDNAVIIHNECVKRINTKLLEISVFPRMKNLKGIKDLMNDLKQKMILPFIINNLKGTAWFSYALSVILYIFTTNNESILKKVKDKNVIELMKICKIIRGKSIGTEFFNSFFEFSVNYISKNSNPRKYQMKSSLKKKKGYKFRKFRRSLSLDNSSLKESNKKISVNSD